MAITFKLIAVYTLITSISAVAIGTPGNDLTARDSVTIMIAKGHGSHLFQEKHSVADCDDKTCNEVCYQHGGSPGRKCEAHGRCVCRYPHGFSLEQEVIGKPSRHSKRVATLISFLRFYSYIS
ncbi:unnamed protein product [Periconia digitata]|uniref:Defensin n=1 Tax=Periconia digitata TaxID=1303443 RepID=A0A9W4XCQ3_9PLEO|nr:unnamed protein product [Periconia digitata]